MISLPLSGAAVYILMDEEESTQEGMTQEVAVDRTIEALGGARVRTLEEATHALFLRQTSVVPVAETGLLTQTTMETLKTAKELKVPVVSLSWLERISGLMTGEHWSEIPVESHRPDFVQKMDSCLEAEDVAEPLGVERQQKIKAQKRAQRSENHQSRRDHAELLGASIGETFAFMTEETPEAMEENAIRRAIELSMLDWALVFRKPNPTGASVTDSVTHRSVPSPYEVLQVTGNATPTEIKAAYRARALQTHPDKGGKPGEFELVARSYRMLLHSGHDEDTSLPRSIKSTEQLDAELRDHEILVRELFQNHGADLLSNLEKLEAAIKQMGLYPKDAGASNLNENNERIRNSCFYLSLAASYLHGIGALMGDNSEMELKYRSAFALSPDEALIGETALDLKRTIEAAVVNAHPEWAIQGVVGENVQAFSDFLVYVLDSPTILSDWAVAVFDTSSGFVDIYKGKNYPENNCAWARSNTISLRYIPGHYQPLFPLSQETRPTLSTLVQCLDTNGVFYVITDGS
jgi:DnaJ-domain-containing protein 1